MPYMVIRGDDNGQNFIVQDGMDAEAAQALYERLLGGHKQWYSICSYNGPDARRDLIHRLSLRL
jgi:hypothetical protein